ncbi:hypothetical protein, partial [Domibacillus tundrae]|uniref:hypothetical protein n=1 Tax=Domibacillus tundrae TaxID=1587527 RepID=UPI001C0F78BC
IRLLIINHPSPTLSQLEKLCCLYIGYFHLRSRMIQQADKVTHNYASVALLAEDSLSIRMLRYNLQ